MFCYLHIPNLMDNLGWLNDDGFSSVDNPAPTSRSLQNDILLKWDIWITLKILAVSTVKRHSNICDVWMESGREVIMLDFCKQADGSWSCLADGTIAFLYVWNFWSDGISCFCFPCTCFLSTKRMMPIKSKQGDKGRKYLHSSCQLSQNAASQKYKERDQEYCRKKQPQQTKLQETEGLQTSERSPSICYWLNVRLFHKYTSCKKGNVWKFSLCEILNRDYRRHVLAHRNLKQPTSWETDLLLKFP